MNPQLKAAADRALALEPLGRHELLSVVRAEDSAFHDALYLANTIRRAFKQDRVLSCSIVSAKQGMCSEDCRFCAQAGRHSTDVETFPLVSQDVIEDAARQAAAVGSHSLGIVVSGRGLRTPEEFERVLASIRSLANAGQIRVCASLGVLDEAMAQRLRDAGIERYHHNLETSRRFFPQVCTTHTYDDRLATLHAARAAGLDLCSGGLFGLGETDEDRVDLAMELRELDVHSAPVNFLNPIPGTPLAAMPLLPPRKALLIIAMFRFALPDKDIKVCGGREPTLRDLQSWMFYAGANGAMIGNYLTTQGRPAAEDWQMIEDLGLNLAADR